MAAMKEPSSTQAPHCSASPSSSSTAAGPSFTAWTHATPPFGSTLRKHTFKPPTLSPTQLLIEVDRAAVNPVDVQIANSSVFKLAALSYPKGIGEDYAGIVIAQGREVIEFAVGDTVLGFYLTALGKPWEGALSQVRIVEASSAVIKYSPSAKLSPTEAASFPLVFQTAVTALTPPYTPKLDSFRPSIVVLGGSSGVGIYAIQYAKSELGAPKIVATCSGKNAEFVRSLGANHVIDYISESILEGLLKHRPAEGYTTILDCVGGTALLPHLGQLLTHADGSSGHPGGGYITIVGDATDSERIGGATVYWYSPRMVWRSLWSWYGLSSKWRYSCISLKASKDKLHKGVELIQDKGIKVVVDSEYEFDDVEKAFKKLRTRRARGKIVIKVKANSDRL
ncbi:BQ5605_C002g01283 [Microbotryum silenes-dioicae]|uniref:BQ5605_C002g01283 protein n=1 Tax=Microbotryum silenes-dioicae TaxID=796604 RepID=A0A2X0LYE5_9BASI|nr:BQ5605_C002g01283 [Microbotryum silenes-dioicae]